MLRARNIIKGFCRTTNPPKQKYLISLYRSEELNIIAVFTTSQRRSGVASPKHGRIIKDGVIVSYVFDAHKVIGKKYNSNEDFSFPLQTTIPFDYCFKAGTQDDILKTFSEPHVVGVLSEDEYIDIVYNFYKSTRTPRKYIPIFEDILEKHFNGR